MRAEIIAIGNELTSGHTLNTNASYLASELESIGIEVIRHTVVKDNIKDIHKAFDTALKDADIIVTSGGLGPTHDDLTHEAISKYFNLKQAQDKNILKELKKKFLLRGYKKMPKINIKQTYKPKQARWIKNKRGTANGIIFQWTVDSGQWTVNSGRWTGNKETKKSKIQNPKSKVVLTFPGVPSELKQMWTDTGKKYLSKLSKKFFLYTKTLKFTGISESILSEKISKILKTKYPYIGIYGDLGEIKIRITAHEPSIKRSKAIIKKSSNKIIQKARDHFIGEDEETLENLVAKKLKVKKLTIATAESCTGGLLVKRLTDVSGSSSYFKLSVVCYSNESKVNLLNVSPNTIRKHGAVSKEVALEMVKGVQKLANSDIAISITGIAGPTGGTKQKPVGLVYFGFANKNKITTKKVFFGSNSTREKIRFLATQYAMHILLNLNAYF